MRTVANPERGCGHLKKGGLYLQSELSPDGTIPAIVEFVEPIVWPEDHFRGWSQANGSQFMELLKPNTIPDGDWGMFRHRLNDIGAELAPIIKETSGPVVGALTIHDLLMWVGESYYKTPNIFVEEVRRLGLNKRLPGKGTPPKLIPMVSRIFLAHKNGEVEGVKHSVIFGYAYVTGIMFVMPDDGRDVPEEIHELEQLGKIEIVHIGPEQDVDDSDTDSDSVSAPPERDIAAGSPIDHPNGVGTDTDETEEDGDITLWDE